MLAILSEYTSHAIHGPVDGDRRTVDWDIDNGIQPSSRDHTLHASKCLSIWVDPESLQGAVARGSTTGTSMHPDLSATDMEVGLVRLVRMMSFSTNVV